MGQEMSDAPRQPPPKKDVALALLEESSMFIHLDPRRPDVLVPKGFMGQPQLVLQVGLNMAIPIPDLHIDEAGISCTLSFSRAPFWCRIPWSAIYALVGEDGRGGVWAEDVPPEIQQQKQSAPSKSPASKKPRAKLTAVGATDRARSRDGGDAASTAGTPKTPGQPRRGLARVPAAAADDDGILEAEPKRAPLSAVPRERPAEPSGGASSADDQAAAPAQPPDKKPKREIPPYLRVIK
jgi:stringent starvation protein B